MGSHFFPFLLAIYWIEIISFSPTAPASIPSTLNEWVSRGAALKRPSPACAFWLRAFRKVGILRATAPAPEIPRLETRASQVIQAFSKIKTHTLQLHDVLESRDETTIEEHFSELFRDDPKLREFVNTSTLAGYPNDGEKNTSSHYRITVQRAVLSSYAYHSGDLPFFERPASSVIRELAQSQSFRQWLEEQGIPDDWKTDLETLAKRLLRDWELETSTRLQPVLARPTEFLNRDLEQKATLALIGDSQFLSSKDGSSWIEIVGPRMRPDIIPRWTGDSNLFTQKMADLKRRGCPSRDSEPSKRPDGYVSANIKEDAPVINNSSGINLLREGKLMRMIGSPQETLINQFILAGSWGYHVTTIDRLIPIVREGWIPNQTPTNPSESARTPGLHLSILLGVTYGIPGKEVTLRVPLNPAEYRTQAFSPYFGHVIRRSRMNTEQVSEHMQFSPDDGVSWYPMTETFIELLKSDLLPVFRGVPKFRNE